MPLPSLLTLIDDIASILDDVSVLTKVAAKKTAGVLGDDLALNAQQVSGVTADRELPVVWAVAKGSVLNKLILVPAALGISAVMPAAISPLLMLGGAFLCFEGFEKVAEKLWPPRSVASASVASSASAASAVVASSAEARSSVARGSTEAKVADDISQAVDLKHNRLAEKDKIRGAVRTDFVLSAEIIVITLGTVATQTFALQVTTLAVVATLMTVGVYGLVAGIVKLDDLGLALSKSRAAGARSVGTLILRAAPWLMKFLGVAGTVAMFLVGGDILAHGIPGLSHATHHWHWGPLNFLVQPMVGGGIGLAAGALLVGIYTLLGRAFPKLRRHH